MQTALGPPHMHVGRPVFSRVRNSGRVPVFTLTTRGSLASSAAPRSTAQGLRTDFGYMCAGRTSLLNLKLPDLGQQHGGYVPSRSPRNPQSVRPCLEPDQALREQAHSYGTGPAGDLAPGPGRLSHHCLPSSALVAAHRLCHRDPSGTYLSAHWPPHSDSHARHHLRVQPGAHHVPPVAALPARLSMISLFTSVPVSLSCHLLRGRDGAVHFCIPTVHGI